MASQPLSWQSQAMSEAEPDTESEPEAGRKRPRLGVLVRMVIYPSLIAFFGWQALGTYRAKGEAADTMLRQAIAHELEDPQPTIVLPNGEVMPILQLSEDEAIERGYISKPSE